MPQGFVTGKGVNVVGLDSTFRWLKKQHVFVEKNMNTAVRVEGYRLKNLLQNEIRDGAPGGVPFSPLSYIARRLSSTAGPPMSPVRQSPNRKPLNRLAVGIRYHVRSFRPYELAVGWVGPDTISDARAALDPEINPFGRGIGVTNITSKRWRRLGRMHQEGFTRVISPKLRRWVIEKGAALGTVEGGDTPFFLLKKTRVFRTSSRPIINPFWQAHRSAAIHNIDNNFRAKMAGRRI